MSNFVGTWYEIFIHSFILNIYIAPLQENYSEKSNEQFVGNLIWNIHSFILNIYIAPLQENYSEALPTPAWLNKAVLRLDKNAGEMVLLKMRSSEGRPFHVEGPTTEKARNCLVEIWAKGTRRRPCWDERSDRELIALGGGQQYYAITSIVSYVLHLQSSILQNL